MHLPAEQDENEPPVTGWTDTDGNGIRASSEEEEVDPLNLIVSVNDDDDDGGGPDNGDNAVGQPDDDMVKLTLARPAPAIPAGQMSLDVSPAGSARLFYLDGTGDTPVWTPFPSLPVSVNFDAPSGPLAALAEGDVDLYMEALAPDVNQGSFIYIYNSLV